MDHNKKCREFASYIKNTQEFQNMNKYKTELDKNKALKKQLDAYLSKKKNITSKYDMENANKKIVLLNKDYESFFRNPYVSKYIDATNQFNSMMANIYRSIENELIK